MFVVRANVLLLVGSIAVIGTIAMRAVDPPAIRDDADSRGIGARLKALVLRMVVLALVVAGCCVFFGAKIGSLAHAAEQVGEGFGDLAGYAMEIGEPPF